MRTSWKQFGETGSLEAEVSQTESSPETGSTRSNYDSVVLMVNDWIVS